jgi:hypothetical protein
VLYFGRLSGIFFIINILKVASAPQKATDVSSLN